MFPDIGLFGESVKGKHYFCKVPRETVAALMIMNFNNMLKGEFPEDSIITMIGAANTKKDQQ